MRILVAEDDIITRRILKEFLSPLGECDIVIDGEEAFHAFRLGWVEAKPYDLVCLDIMMPNTDGQEALKMIRQLEKEIGVPVSGGVKVIMITALGDPKTVMESYYKGGATSYIVKPIDKSRLLDEIHSFELTQ
jgi:two-component system, chemotaxis family, chemotaxis protein CheY